MRTSTLEHPAALESHRRLLVLTAAHRMDPDRIGHTVRWAADRHHEQRRRSGEPYITHCLEVAALVADIGGSEAMVQAALLHDTVEDTPATLTDVTAAFGAEVGALVDGCTKVSIVHPDADMAQRQAENLRKLFVAMAADPRVIVVKLCDRLHNLRTIGALPPEKARRIGEETLAVHAPLAHRLGLGALKSELEDRAYAAADPEAYAQAQAAVTAAGAHHHLEEARTLLHDHLAGRDLTCETAGRVKHAWSAQRKARRMGVDPLELPDLLGLRVICETEPECYAVLDAVHDLWEPDLSRLRDYINHPKTNSYRSLHTTVTGPQGRRLEVQVRTRTMHEEAEHGAAAHHAYKHPGQEPAWVSRLLAWAGEDLTAEEYLEGVHGELIHRKEILVLTPRNDIVELPAGACVVDFAYAIHSAIGDTCVGAKVDGVIVPLETRLRNGQRVEIVTGARNGPSEEWLTWVRTSKARARIRAHVLRTRGPETPPSRPAETTARRTAPPRRISATGNREAAAEDLVPMSPGLHRVTMRIAGCCRPSPGRHVTGIVNRSDVSVHLSDCPALEDTQQRAPGRQVPVHWIRPGHRLEELRLTTTTRGGLHTDIAAAVGSVGGSLVALDVPDDGTALVTVSVRAERLRDLRAALRLVLGVRAVT